ncbi:hypothetical protein [Mycolicibacterium diernhoferi]|uniref:LppI n=1 Tax=Mycolicibacterium diernhoferi TaxID=1801 RepID=A0A1Q4HJN9_9MYCO|nr:hypothetical protein [Mycolicibacterium diernhoferi]OJZ67713.1 hypothetical protein BRW64_05515 [Mycolicibacterium diernhoferi]OPE55455.1 hypothetical protein BV510_05065 [Mycolicibacterium diernhoferi]QYL20357.1 hypothetical protein K0O62_14645 [Mycolicibacterium diernhoferi]
MRLLLLVMTSALVAGCTQTLDSEQSTARTPLSVAPPTATSGTGAPATTSSSAQPSGELKPGADIGAVISWIEDGEPAAPEDFGTVTRDGTGTDLDGGVAFTTDTVNCISTPKYRDGALACLVDLDDPPPRPADVFTVWKGNWVDFDGTAVEIGSQRGDPGPFVDGEGAALTGDSSLAFGDFRCRSDADAVLCVNYAERSAVRMDADGVDGFGCLTESAAPPGIGVRLSC